MKEYHIVFKYRPGSDTVPPEYVFVETEDENGKGVGAGAWEGFFPQDPEGGLVYLVLPTYKEERDKLLKACIYARNEMVVKTEGEYTAYITLQEAIDFTEDDE